MADSDLIVAVQIDGRPAIAALSQVEGAAGRVTVEVTRLDAGFRQLQSGLIVPRSTADELDRIAAAARNIPRGGGAPIIGPNAVPPGVVPALQGVTTQGGAAQQTMFGLAAAFDDAQQFQYGFSQGMRATTNNLQPLIAGFAAMQVQAAASGTTLGATLGAALTGPAGILIGLTLVAAAAPYVADAVDEAFTTTAEKAAEAAVSVDQLFESTVATADEFREAADAVFNFSLETDSFTVSSEAQAEAMAEVLVQERDATKARIEGIEATMRAATTADVYSGFIGATVDPLQAMRDAVKEANDELLEQETLLERVRQAQRLYSLQQRAVAFGESQGLQTDAERAAAERAEREAERATERARTKAERDALTARRRADRAAATAARRAARDADRAAARLAEERGRLDLQLRVELAREGSDRVLATLRQEYDQRMRIAGDGLAAESQLETAVRLAYAREVTRAQEREIQEREDRLLGSLARIEQAEASADRAAGVADEQLGRERIDRIKAEAKAQVALMVDRAAADGVVIQDQATIVEYIQQGAYEQARRLAVLVAEQPALQGALDLLLERLEIEGQVAGVVRDRGEEQRRQQRADLRTEDELEARRQRANERIADPGRTDNPFASDAERADQAAADAQAHVDRLNRAVGDIDAEIARLNGEAAEAAAVAGQVEVETAGAARLRAAELERLAAERIALSAEVDEAVVAGSEQAADAVVDAHKRQLEAARDAVQRTLGVIEDALTRRREISDLDIEVQQEQFRQEEKALRDSLRTREISQREYSLAMRQLAQDRAGFERDVAEDQKTVGDALLADSLSFAKQTASAVISAEIAKGTAGFFADVLKFFGFLGPFAPVAAAATVPAMLGVFNAIIPGFAVGGQVTGPGSGTSDDVLAWLSAGEHVFTARAAAGQHAALRTLNARMEAGLDLDTLLRALSAPRFAFGGVVTPRPVPRSAPLASDRSAALDLSPVTAELRATRVQMEQQGREIARLAVPRVVDAGTSRRIERQATRERLIRTGR